MAFSFSEFPKMAYLSFPEMKHFLVEEFQNRFSVAGEKIVWHGEMAVVDGVSDVPYFCRAALKKPFLLHFDSVGDAANALKSIQRNWASYQFQFFRRAALIQDKLPYINFKPKTFPFQIPKSPIGIFTLLDEHTILGSEETSSFLPAGKIEFVEDHENPPSRAYLKLWEAITMMNLFFGVDFPKDGEKVFDAGACPGGWTWGMTERGCNVLAVDRAELAPSLMANPKVTFRTHDAFTIEPCEVGECDWLLSDVICYPGRLYEWVCKWIESGLAKNIICTIKMQGQIDWKIVEKFARIENSQVLHLNYNKHELCFLHKK